MTVCGLFKPAESGAWRGTMRGSMGRALCFMLFLATVSAAGTASAQFSNRRLGLELGGYRFTDQDITVGIPIILEGTYYIENSFDVGIRVSPLNVFLTRAS